MATTGKANGTLCVIAVGGTDIAYLTSNSLSFEMATRDATTKDSAGNTEILEALRSFSVTGEGYFVEDATYEGSMFITSLQKTDGLEETSTFSVSLNGTGAVTKAAEA